MRLWDLKKGLIYSHMFYKTMEDGWIKFLQIPFWLSDTHLMGY
jgi:hypothetical protein